MIERFFSTITITAARQSDGGTNYQHDTDTITLLSGPPSCGKTSLLFQYALNCAAEPEGYVVFICNRRRLEAKPPFLSQGIDPSSELFQRIQIKYVEDDQAIKKYFAAFHLLQPPPSAVIVDDFGDLFHESKCQQRYGNARGRDLAMVRVLALCQSAIVRANPLAFDSVHPPRLPSCDTDTAPCKLLLSDTHHGDAPRLSYIYKRWISSMFIIEGHGPGSFLVKSMDSLESTARTKWTARYSIALQYLVLEGITEDAQPIWENHFYSKFEVKGLTNWTKRSQLLDRAETMQR
ncbi:hypothetical protein Cgig2_028550 [Carnegiea gigantea]|uniref:Uncharacterized protein n=1 Tax=Carnegiea gigantea TaxID=171969 RepID=A0A9Q1JWP4_9CARY|nr:hypothetical protein Cgig2_028550 [Carnegiea gigantea]